MDSSQENAPLPFADLLERVRAGDDSAIGQIWEDYYQQLVRIAARRLPANLRRTGDEEDIAISAFHSFIAGIRDDQFPDLSTLILIGSTVTGARRNPSAHAECQDR